MVSKEDVDLIETTVAWMNKTTREVLYTVNKTYYTYDNRSGMHEIEIALSAHDYMNFVVLTAKDLLKYYIPINETTEVLYGKS